MSNIFLSGVGGSTTCAQVLYELHWIGAAALAHRTWKGRDTADLCIFDKGGRDNLLAGLRSEHMYTIVIFGSCLQQSLGRLHPSRLISIPILEQTGNWQASYAL